MTYKDLLEYYRLFGIIKAKEVEQLNRINDPEVFKATFKEYCEVWRMRKQVRDNKANKAALDGEEAIYRDMRKAVLKKPNLIQNDLRGKTPEQVAAIKADRYKLFNNIGLGDYYKEISES